MRFKTDIDWVSTIVQIVSCVAIGFAAGVWWALVLACIWMFVNWKKNDG